MTKIFGETKKQLIGNPFSIPKIKGSGIDNIPENQRLQSTTKYKSLIFVSLNHLLVSPADKPKADKHYHHSFIISPLTLAGRSCRLNLI
jgi:hypothetical protein